MIEGKLNALEEKTFAVYFKALLYKSPTNMKEKPQKFSAFQWRFQKTYGL
jgi:hypothetical protein